jgi:hypothetical protein
VQNRLWHFDPWHVGWQETPWVALTEPQTFKNPRGLAVGNLYIWVLDDTGLVEVDRRTYKRVKIVNLPGVNDVKKVCALSANGNEDLFIASDTQISAFARQKDGSYTLVWQSLKTFKTVATLAMVDDVLIVIDSGRSQIVFLDTRTGRLAGRVNRDAVPGGMVPTSLATSGRWIFIFDQAGNRILRFKLEKNK